MPLLDERSEYHPGIYLAYSIHLNNKEMQYYCSYSRFFATIELPGYALVFRGNDYRAVPTLQMSPANRVPAVLWLVLPQDIDILNKLWRYPEVYQKETFPVNVGEKSYQAFAYVLQKKPNGKKIQLGRPSMKTYITIASGYQKHGFDRNILDEAVEFSRPLDPRIDLYPF